MTRGKSSTSVLIPLLLVIVGMGAGYIYYSNFMESIMPPELPAFVQNDSLSNLKDLNIDFKILDNARYKTLEIFGESPVSPGILGKKNIFAN